METLTALKTAHMVATVVLLVMRPVMFVSPLPLRVKVRALKHERDQAVEDYKKNYYKQYEN